VDVPGIFFQNRVGTRRPLGHRMSSEMVFKSRLRDRDPEQNQTSSDRLRRSPPNRAWIQYSGNVNKAERAGRRLLIRMDCRAGTVRKR